MMRRIIDFYRLQIQVMREVAAERQAHASGGSWRPDQSVVSLGGAVFLTPGFDMVPGLAGGHRHGSCSRR